MRTRLVTAWLIAVVLPAATPALLASDLPSPPLTAAQIVSRMVEMDARRLGNTPAYRGTRYYSVDYKGFPGDRHAEMSVEVLNTSAGKQFTIISESGSKLLLNRVLHRLLESEREAADGAARRDIKLNPDNYDFELLGTDSVEGRDCYALQVTPKKKNKFVYRGKVWIDARDFAVAQIVATPAKNPSFWISSVEIEHHYAKHGEAWLPRSNRSTSKVRFGGRAVLTIDYQRYEFTQQNAGAVPVRRIAVSKEHD